jgi:hypothetical protein
VHHLSMARFVWERRAPNNQKWRFPAWAELCAEVRRDLGHIVALHHRSSASYQIC